MKKEICESSAKFIAFDETLKKEKNVMCEQTKQKTVLQIKERCITLPEQKERFDSNEFFQTCAGLWVYNNFRTIVLARAKPVESAPAMQIATFDLERPANDEQIQAKLPEGFVFTDVSIFCFHLAGMIKSQAGGVDGHLQSNGHANILYAQTPDGVFAVYVHWHAGFREWYVIAYPLHRGAWSAGSRVFSATAVS